MCGTCDDSIVNFMNENEDANDPNLDYNDSSECEHSKQGRKRLIGGPVEETFFTLAHSLRCFSDLTMRVLVKKKFKFFLPAEQAMTPLSIDLA